MSTSAFPSTGGTRRHTVLVVDDHPMVAEMIARACQDRGTLDVLGFLTSGAEAILACRMSGPDVLVLDLEMPGTDGFDVIRSLNAAPSPTRILAISERDDPGDVLRCMRLGVAGFLEKTWPAEHIAVTVEDIAAGASRFSSEHRQAVQPVLAEMARRSRTALVVASSLTRRERQVLELLAKGYSNRKVASALDIAERTVESHLFGLYGKLGARSRVQAVRRASELNLIGSGVDPEAMATAVTE